MPSRILVPLIIAFALFMENLDSTVLATALPAIAADLGEDPIRLKLALTSYLLSLAIFIPASGWLADRFGARLIFCIALVTFTAGSIMCAISSSIGGLVLARIIQGLGGAMMVPVGRLVILKTVPKHELVGSLAWLTVPALIGPVMGPPLGGFITTYFSWRWIFWINVPIGILGFILATLYVPDVRGAAKERFDATGFVLSAIGLSVLLAGATTLGLDILPGVVVLGCLSSGAVLLGLYVRHARRTPTPILDLSLLRIPTFRASVVGGGLFRIGIGATPFLLPLMLQLGFGMTPFESGMVTFAGAVGAIIMKFLARPILRRYGFRPVLVLNALICGIFAAVPAAYTEATPILLIVAILLTGGLFRSLQFTSINAIAFADIEPEHMSRATSLTSVTQQVALAVGISIGALMLEATTRGQPEGIFTVDDFAPAFLVIGVISGMAALVFRRLPRDAGSEMSGHATRPRGDAVTQMRERG
jgi:EmrB/QacA subfamily drug resistance transporter